MQIDKTNRALLALIRCAMFGEDISDNPDILALSEQEWDNVYSESATHGVWGIAFEGASTIKNIVPKQTAEKWFKSVYSIMVSNQKVLYAQTKLIELLKNSGIRYVILKGTSACVSYKNPAVRVMGDVDFLVKYEDVKRATQILLENGYTQLSEEHHCHLEFARGGVAFEMHFEANGIPDGAVGDKIRHDMDERVINCAVKAMYENTEFYSPDPFSNALVFLLHMEHHILGDGIGLRQMCDWAAFVNSQLSDDVWNLQLRDYLESIGMLTFAEYMNEICYEYLGMPRRSWMRNTEKAVCEELMRGILLAGNFGKRNEVGKYSGILISDETNKNLAIIDFFKYLVTFIKVQWPKAKKWPILIPAGFVYFPLRYIFQMLSGKRPSIKTVMDDKKQRQDVFSKMAIFETEGKK